MSQTTNDEIDFISILSIAKQKWRNFLISIYKTITFLTRNWKLTLSLILAGVIFGYISQKDSKPPKEAKVLVKANFDSSSYLYNALEQLTLKMKAKDTAFFNSKGISINILDIREIVITPVVNFKEITKEYQENDVNFSSLLRYLEFDKEVKLSDVFNSKYNYHTLDIQMYGAGSNKSLENLFKYLNGDPQFEGLKKTGLDNLKTRILENQKLLGQIDVILDNYKSNQSLVSPSEQIFVVDKNLNISQVIEKKMKILEETEDLKKDLLYSTDVIVSINQLEATDVKPSILSYKIVIYPVLFIVLLLLFNYFKNLFYRVKSWNDLT